METQHTLDSPDSFGQGQLHGVTSRLALTLWSIIVKLTRRDREILAALCNHVRLFTLGQIAGCWWAKLSNPTAAAKRRLAQLQEQKLLVCFAVLARPLPVMEQSILSWTPADPEPDLAAAAWKLQHRWRAETTRCDVYLASKLATTIFGGRAKGQLKRQYQATHDLGVSEMYLQLKRSHSPRLQYWIGEDVLAPHRRGQKLPDAVIATLPGATPQLVLEFGGAYDKIRVNEFHQDCYQRALPYEIW